MFYNEQKKPVRTKKEILDDSGNVRKGCNIIKKGEVYERTLFTAKNKLFKQEHYLDEAKRFYTDLINLLMLESKIATKNEEIRTLKAGLSGIVRQHGFATVQDFYTAFYTAQRATEAYLKEYAKWDEAYGEKATPKAETMHEKIQRYKEKVDRQYASQPYRSRDKGAR